MILGKLQDSSRYEGLHPLFKAFFDYVKAHDMLQMECGRIEIEGDRLFINNMNPECKAADEQLFEAHRDYIDIHLLLEGEEKVGWKALSDIGNEVQAYDKTVDCALYSDRADAFIDLLPGHFLIAFPEDAHAPMIGKGKIRKLIGKIKV